MLNYDDLTPKQRNWVDLTMCFFDFGETITSKEIHEVHDFFYAKREEDRRFKTGYPAWLEKENSVSRGVFHFPKPDNVFEEEVVEDSPLEREYQQELLKFGIKKE